MSLILSCQAIAKSFGSQDLFSGLSCSIFAGDRIGLVGPNGVGKSTLLQILAGLEKPDQGQVTRRSMIKVGYIPQTPSFPSASTPELCLQAAGQEAGIASDDLLVSVPIILSQLGFDDATVSIGSLSGGWLKRLAIGCGMIGRPDLLLLDEPTNHLDWDGILWLESFLGKAPFAWLMISHDRYILNQTVTKILEVNPGFPGFMLETPGGYDAHVQHRDEFMAAQAQYGESLANKVRREEEWLRQGVKARTTKAKYRIDQAKTLQDELKQVRQRLTTKQTQIEFTGSSRQTKKLLALNDLSLSLGGKCLMKNLSYTLTGGSFVGLLGGNGAGKSSLLKLLLGQLSADSGTVERAPNLRLVYFDQQRQSLDLAMTLKQALCPHGDTVIYQDRPLHVVSWAKRFGFRSEQLEVTLNRLSGGEQARILIARLMLEPADVLLLDEPTNDLDIPTLEVLEDSLLDFQGAIILVTHDRYMLGRVCDRFLAFMGNGQVTAYASIEQWQKEYSQNWQAQQKGSKKLASSNSSDKDVSARSPSSKKLSYKEQREFEGMEEAVLNAENEVVTLQQAAEDPAVLSNASKLQEIYTALQTAQERVERLYSRWSELEGKIN